MDEEIIKKVFKRVQLCMMSLVGDSGQPVSYSLLPHTFNITKVEELEKGLKKYYFTAKAYSESELKVHDENYKLKTEDLTGSVVLDRNFGLARDEKGNVMIEPWKCGDLSKLKKISTPKERTKKLLYDKLKGAEEIVVKIMEECALEPNNMISLLLADIQERLSGSKISPDVGLQDAKLEDIYINVIEGVMIQELLAPDNDIKLLLSAIQKRLDNFDVYFDKFVKGELKGPFLK